MKKPELNKRALKRAFLTSFARLIGVGIAAGAGSLIHQLVGGGTFAWTVAVFMVLLSFTLMLFAEYEKERG